MSDAKEKNCGLFWKIVLTEDGQSVAFGLCVKTCAGRLAPHILTLHGLRVGPCFTDGDEGDIPIYT